MFAALVTTSCMSFNAGPSNAFDSMLAGLQCQQPVLTFVDSPNQRTLLRGSTAVASDPQVRRAFQILYEDLRLFRPAGNLLAARLASVAGTANELYQSLGSTIDDSLLPRLRGLFDAIDQDQDGSLDPDELAVAAKRAAWAPGAAAQLCLDEDCTVSYSFCDFVLLVAPTQRASPRLADDEDDAAAPTGGVSPVADLPTTAPERTESSGWGGRFDRMADEFRSWEQEAEACWEGRTGEIVTGCFAGARSPEVVGALRLVYCENAVLRGAGDLVFRMLRPASKRRA